MEKSVDAIFEISLGEINKLLIANSRIPNPVVIFRCHADFKNEVIRDGEEKLSSSLAYLFSKR